MHEDVQRYRKQLRKNPARGRVLREVEAALEEAGDRATLAEILGERLRALEEAGARAQLIHEIRQRCFDARIACASTHGESLAAARSALAAAELARGVDNEQGCQHALVWALVRGVSDTEVRARAIELAGDLETARGLAKAALKQDPFKERKGALRHVLSCLAEQAGETDAAFFDALRAARTAPPMRRYLDEAFRLALMTGRHEEVALVFADAVTHPEIDRDLRSYLELKLAHLYERHLGREADALQIYQRRLAEQGDDSKTHKRAQKLADKLGVELRVELCVGEPAQPEPDPFDEAASPPALPPASDPAIAELDEVQQQEMAKLPLPRSGTDVFSPLQTVESRGRASDDEGSADPARVEGEDPDVYDADALIEAEEADVFASAEDDGELAQDAPDFSLSSTLAAEIVQSVDHALGDAIAPSLDDREASLPKDDEITGDDGADGDTDHDDEIDDGDIVEASDLVTVPDPVEDDIHVDTSAPAPDDVDVDTESTQANAPPLPADSQGDEPTGPDVNLETTAPAEDAPGFDAEEVQTQEIGDAQILEVSEAQRALHFDAEALEAAGRFDELAEGLVERLPSQPATHDLLRIADLYETQLGDPARAFPLYARALEHDDDADALAGVLRTAPGAPDAATALFESLLESRGARSEAVASLGRIVAAGDAERGELELALARLEPVFAKRTGDAGLFRQLDKLYRDLGQAARRADLRARANFGDAVTRLGMLADRVELLDEAGDMQLALETARSLQAAKPSDVEVARRVLGLADKLDDDAARHEALLALLPLADHDEALSAARRLAALVDAEADVATARTAWREVLRRNPGDAEALRALSDLLDGDEALQAELIEVLNLRLTIAQNTDNEAQQLMVLHRLADLYGRLHRSDDEEQALRQALSVDPEDDAALRLLEDRWRERGALKDLAELFEEIAAARQDSATALSLWLDTAQLYRSDLKKKSKAREAYTRALEIDPDDGAALGGLAELCVELGDPEAAVVHLERATRRKEGPALADNLCQLGLIYEEHLMRGADAVRAFERALQASPGHVDAVQALSAMYRRAEEWPALVTLLVHRAEHDPDPEHLAAALVEAATVAGENLGDRARARELLVQALKRAPDDEDARLKLIDVLIEDEEIGRAREHIEHLLARAEARGEVADLPVEHLVALGRALAQEGQSSQAQEHLRQALERAPSHLGALRGLADVLLDDGDADPEECIAVLEQRLLHHGPQLDPAEAARVYGHVGILRRGLGDGPGAKKALRHALARLDDASPNIDVLAAHAEILAEDEQYEQACEETERLAEMLDGAQAAARWMQAGQLAELQLQDLDRALRCYQQAAEHDPERMDAFEAQLRVEVARGHAEGALQAAEALIEKEVHPQRLSRLEMAVAAICQQHLDDGERALHYLRRAVDHDPQNSQALHAAESLFEDLDDPEGHASLLDSVLANLPRDDAARRVELLDRLVQIRRYDLRDREGAVRALEQILALDDNNPKAREDLARLLSELGQADRAVDTWREILSRDAVSQEAYRALLALFRRLGRYDAAYCVAATMVALEQADDDVRAVVKRLRPPFPNWPKVPADPSRVQRALVHPQARGPVRDLLALAAPAVWSQYTRSLKDFGLRRRDLLSPGELPSSLALAMRQATRVLDVPEPSVYRGGREVSGVRLLALDRPALVIGADVQRGGMTPERAFAFGRTIAYLRPENLLAATLSTAELRGICEAVLLRAMPKVEMDRATKQLDRLGSLIEKRLDAAGVDRLVDLGRTYLKLRGSFSMQRFVSATAFGTDRVGFVFAGELAAAVAALKAEAGREHLQSARLAIKELVSFSVSADYVALRQELGLHVRASDAEKALSLDA